MSESVNSLPSAGDHYVDENVKETVPLAGIDPEDERKAVRRLDYCLLPIMTMFYLLSFLVRCSNRHITPILFSHINVLLSLGRIGQTSVSVP